MSEKFKGICPLCFGEGCDKCEDGKTDFKMAKGNWYTRKCEECGFENGACVEWALGRISDPCIRCGGGNVHWEFIG